MSDEDIGQPLDPALSGDDQDPVRIQLNTEITILRKELHMRTELARVVSSYSRPANLLPNILSILCQGFGAQGGAIYFMEKGTDKITLKATHGLDPTYAMKYQQIHMGSHVTGKVAQTGEGMIIRDASSDQRSTKGVIEILHYRSAVVTPVISESNVVGIIALISETPNFFTEKDLKNLDQIGAFISLAIVNSFLNQEIREEKESTLDILERLDEGIFEVEVKNPIPLDLDVETMSMSFFDKAYFTLMNHSFMKQCEEELWLGGNISSGFDEKQLFKMLKVLLAEGEVKGIERRWMKENEKIYELSMVRVDKDGEIKGIKGVRRDITSSHRMKEKIQRSRSQTEFYMDLIAHDLSNINTTIHGFLEMMEEKVDRPQDVRRFIMITKKQITRSSKMIQKVKVLLGIQRMEPKLVLMDISTRIEPNFHHVKMFYPNTTAILNFDPGLSSIIVKSDSYFDNLIQSIFEIGLEGSKGEKVEIDLEIKRYEFDGTRGYLFCFSMNCRKISDFVWDRVFKKKITLSGAPAGAGLGMSIVEKLILRYHGNIWIEDRKEHGDNEGARIMLFLPSE